MTIYSVSEERFQQAVIELAGYLGWKVHAERPGRTHNGWVTPIQGDRGWPDVALLKPPRFVVAELKSEKGRTTIDQDDWLGSFREVPGIEVYIWKPKDWKQIERILKRAPELAEETEVVGWPV